MNRLLPFPLRLLTATCLLAGMLHAEDSTFPQQVQVGESKLTKIGEGKFRWFFVHVYDGSLYVDAETPGADPLSDVAKRLELAYQVSISAEDFVKSGMKILRENVGPAKLAPLVDRLQRFNAAYRPVSPGDRYALTYVPGSGTTLALNGEPLVTIEGADFARAYFSIWLGSSPVKESLREDLLGL